jgi:L-amino acid N-acyltransferase YncA
MYQVRRGKINDVEVLVRFTLAEAAAAAPDIAATVRSGVLAALADESNAIYIVLEDAGQIVGHACVSREWSTERAGHFWTIQSMHADPSHKDKMLRELVFDVVRGEAASNGALGLRLCVHKDNAAAIHASQKRGFLPSDYQLLDSHPPLRGGHQV